MKIHKYKSQEYQVPDSANKEFFEIIIGLSIWELII